MTAVIAVLAAVVKLATALPVIGRYGWDRDELYYLQAAHHLGFGYVDFPPMTALVGRVTIDLFGPSLVALRMTGVLAGMLTAALIALCARELGGGARAQALASIGFVLTPYGLSVGVLFHPTMFDTLTWAAFAYVALRILRRPEPRLWPLLGAIAGIGLETKGTIAMLIGVFVIALVTVGPRDRLRDRRAWLGAAVMVALALPYVGWEIAHGWPTLTFLPTQNAASSTPLGDYAVEQLLFLGAAAVLVVIGTVALWRRRDLRTLSVLTPAITVLFAVEHGRSYYALPAIAPALAAGSVSVERWWGRTASRGGGRRRRAAAVLPVLGLQLAALGLGAPVVWPVLPTATMVRTGIWRQSFYKDELGWPQMADATARVWRGMSPATRRATAVLAANYGEAGALDLYGPSRGLPAALSGHLSFQYWHPRTMPQRELITVGFDAASLTSICSDVRVVARAWNRWGVDNEEQGAPIALCRLRAPLGRLWSRRIATDDL